MTPFILAVASAIALLWWGAWRQWRSGRDTPLATSEFLGLRLYGYAPEDPERWVSRAAMVAYLVSVEGARAGLWTGDAFREAIKGCRITLRPAPWLHDGQRTAGLTWPGGVEVAYTPHPRDGALAHELVHLWAERTGLGIDYDHADGDGHWTPEVDRVIARVRGVG